MQKVLTFALAAALLAGSAQAQTRSGARPAARPANHTAPKASVKRPAAPATRPTPVLLAAAPATHPTERASSQAPQAKTPAVQPARQPAGDLSFGKGTNALNLGIGFGLGYNYGYGYSSNLSQTPAMSLSYMRGVAQAGPGVISAGGVVGYKSITWKDGGESATWRNIYVGARGAYHYGFHNSRLDTYAGLGLGVRVVSYTDSYGGGISSTASGSQAELSAFAGARYFFTDKIGAFSELGYDMSYLKLGLSARF